MSSRRKKVQAGYATAPTTFTAKLDANTYEPFNSA
jgi:hypothetical protein